MWILLVTKSGFANHRHLVELWNWLAWINPLLTEKSAVTNQETVQLRGPLAKWEDSSALIIL